MATITPGSKINVKIVKKPTNAAALKTVVRLLSKDRTVVANNARLKKARKTFFRQNRRGGRFWDVNVVKQPGVVIEPGLTKTLTATLDVLTDLKGLGRFIEVTAA